MRQALSYSMGLDIGIASVGWCVLGEQRIIDLGVRAFDKAETPDGESLNKGRRDARLLRRRLRRRAWRLLKLARLFKREGLLSDGHFFKQNAPVTESLWALRVAGLDRQLSNTEWARVIYHLCKHRGFWFARKSEATASEGGKVKQGLECTRNLMQSKNYRSAAEMMLTEFPRNQRNKRGDYGQSLGREILAEELQLLFSRQRELGNPHTHAAFEAAILSMPDGLFWQQKPALSGGAMLNLIGKCTFEKAEYRAAKHSWSAERFVWLTRLNNLRIIHDGEKLPLSADARQAAMDLPYTLASVKYKQLKDKLVKLGLLPESARFAGLSYHNGKDPEDAKLIELSGWHTLRKALEGAGLKTEWHGIATRPELLDQITTVLSVYKTDTEIAEQLTQLKLIEPVIQALLSVSFTDFIRLSLKALQGILPPMQAGQRYDEACLVAGYHHSQQAPNTGSYYLPKFDEDVPNNPVVQRALNQARKIVNALIHDYGSPASVHIEMARDLSRSLDERSKIQKEQEAYAARNEQNRERFTEHFGRKPNGREFEKWQLYREQDGKCAYSLQAIDLNRLISDQNYTEIDHALPYSRSFDNSKNNKVLVLIRENRDKSNRTPYEYLGGAHDSPRWQAFAAFVSSNRQYRQAKRERLLRKHFSDEDAREFKDRNLNDTRYACRYFKNFVEQHLALSSEQQRCIVVNGQLTSFLRARWGLAKLREGSDRHHAIDAAVVAACSHGMVKRLADYARRKELAEAREGLVDMETGEILNPARFDQLKQHFPSPWDHFSAELCLRTGLDRHTGQVNQSLTWEDTCAHLAKLAYDDLALAQARPLLVSRAPKRRNGGAAHKDTIYATRPTPAQPNRVTQKIALSNLTLADLDNLIEPHRNAALYDALRAQLTAHGGKAEKAFAAAFFKPTAPGKTGPIVRTVTKVINTLSGIPLRGGIAKNDSMIRADLFTKDGKYYLIPLYIHHRAHYQATQTLPNRAISAGKEEADWTVIDDSYTFCFSLYPNDLIRIHRKGKPPVEGYYAGLNRSTGAIGVWVHDRNQQIGKDGLVDSIGVKMATNVEKFNVDVLGRTYPCQPGPRRGLA